jgi:hypothetical protein
MAISAVTVAGFFLVSSALVSEAQTVQGGTATSTARLARIISRGDAAISERLASLDALNTRVQAMVNVSANLKANITSEVQTNESGLTALKVKMDADTDVPTAINDEKSIYNSYRIYALVIPRGYVVASADRIDTIVGMMTAIAGKLQTRINSDPHASTSVAVLASALSDIKAKLALATNEATAASGGVVSLVPDQGNQTLLQSNTAAIKSSRSDIASAVQDLQAARADIRTIIKGL